MCNQNSCFGGGSCCWIIIIALIWIAYMLHTVNTIANLVYNKELERF